MFGCRGTDNDDNDPELAEALKQSMQTASGGEYAPQETGITGTHTSPTNPNFAPAQENKEYNPSEWALTTTATQEVSQEPPPVERKRAPGTPAFLRPSFSSYYLAGALTILHSIPRARESLLARDYTLSNYWYNPKWWTGGKIQTSRVVDLDNPRFSLIDAEEEVAEVQRLMAFLDGTDRAYGCVEILGDLPKVREQEQTAVPATFFKSWDLSLSWVYDSQVYRDMEVFTSVAHQIQTDGSDRDQTFQILETTISQSDLTLYSALDTMVWTDEENPVYVDFADVVNFQIKTDMGVQGTGIDIPAALYLDRYTKPWLESVKDLKEKIAAQKSRIIDLEAKEERLKSFGSMGIEFNTKTLLEITTAHFATPLRVYADDGSGDITMDSQPELPDPTPLLKELLRKLEKNLSNLERQKQEAQDILQKLQRTFTSPDECTPNSLPLTKYSLRGVCTSPSKTYVLLPNKDEHCGPEDAPEQWWQFSWIAQSTWGTETQYGTHETVKVTEEEVLLAAKTEGDTVLMVYANDNAFQGGDPSLPEPLKDFVARDNAEFAAELEPPPPLLPPPSPSPERKRSRQQHHDDEEMRDQSPKRSSNSTRSSETMGAETPLDSPADSINGSVLPADGIQDIESLLPPIEMTERGGHIAPVAKAIHLRPAGGKMSDTDDDEMPDVEHIEMSDPLQVEEEEQERKGG
ncbi:hypothetical protein K440DRAFT_588153 [Wilcoxina mikolae CBS 423.85]|nr:hypothetical protein K440DRAFT_588153 [Wilcoxina mikolae CBS 423.85]